MTEEFVRSPDNVRVEIWRPDTITQNATTLGHDIHQLIGLLEACVRTGASVSFVLPFSRGEAAAFWRDQVAPAVAEGTRRVLLARLGGEIAGTVQLDLGTPPNQAHRAEVKKLLVHPDARRRGIARSLMIAIEEEARRTGRTLLTLDTISNGAAERLYRSLGYVAAGIIPDYALNFDGSALEATTVMYKQLGADADSPGSLSREKR